MAEQAATELVQFENEIGWIVNSDYGSRSCVIKNEIYITFIKTTYTIKSSLSYSYR